MCVCSSISFSLFIDKTIRGGADRSKDPDVHSQQRWMTTASPANSTGLNIPTSLQICKYVDLEGCPLLLRPCSNFLERSNDGGERGEKTAPALHIRACFGLQHQLLITFLLPPLPRGLGSACGAGWNRRRSATRSHRAVRRGVDASRFRPIERAAGGTDSVLRPDQSQMQEVGELQSCTLLHLQLLSIWSQKLLYP